MLLDILMVYFQMLLCTSRFSIMYADGDTGVVPRCNMFPLVGAVAILALITRTLIVSNSLNNIVVVVFKISYPLYLINRMTVHLGNRS